MNKSFFKSFTAHFVVLMGLLALLAAPLSAQASTTTAGSSTGGHIVFQSSSGGAIYVVNADGTGLRQLTTGMDPAVSPDGQWVAFTRWNNSGTGSLGSVWVIGIDGKNERQILGDVRQPKSPTWSTDGTQIVINMQQGGTTAPVRRCIAPGQERPPRDAYDITMENGKLCFTVPADPHWGLRRITVATGSFEDLARDTYSFAPTWDPAQSWRVVFVGKQGLVNLDLNQNTTWTLSSDSDQRSPVFSPDGSKLAVSYQQDNHWEVHVMNADGSGEQRLTQTSSEVIVAALLSGQKAQQWNNASPAWSPDGSQIAFVSDRTGQWQIWIMNSDGSNQHPLFASGQGPTLQYNGVDERMISWGK